MVIFRFPLLLISFLVFGISCQQVDSANTTEKSSKYKITKEDLVLGETVSFHSDVLDEERTLNIYLPADYGVDPLKKYNTIYLLDGSKDEDFIHIAGLAQFANFPWAQILEPTIIVGIANVDRKRDFTYPSNNEKDNTDLPTSGGSENFINFIEKELQPFISDNYPANNNRTIIGQSLGGLLSVEILYKRPSLFTNYIIVSPSLWWDDQSLLSSMVMSPLEAQKTVYLAVGKEGEEMESVAKLLHEKLKAINEDELRIHFDYLEDMNHGNILHLAVYRAFERFFSC